MAAAGTRHVDDVFKTRAVVMVAGDGAKLTILAGGSPVAVGDERELEKEAGVADSRVIRDGSPAMTIDGESEQLRNSLLSSVSHDLRTPLKIFDKFYRAEKGRGGGVGLGLTICRGIITAHGGEIWPENRNGGGGAFHFTQARGRARAPAIPRDRAGRRLPPPSGPLISSRALHDLLRRAPAALTLP